MFFRYGVGRPGERMGLFRCKVVVVVVVVVVIVTVSSPVTGLEWPRGFQEVKVPRFHDNGTGRW